MERYQSIVTIALAVGLSFRLTPVDAASLTVKKNSRLSSIKSAIEQAQPFDTIIVHPGIYTEQNISIRKPLVLRGIDKPVLDGEKKYELISIFSSDVTVEGFELRSSGQSSMKDLAGIKAYSSSRIVIRNNRLYDVFFGIYFSECTASIAADNTLESFGIAEVQSGNGIHCWKSDSMLIEDNDITGQRDGIYFEFVTHSTIQNNNSHGNIRYGLHFMFSHNNDYLNNIFQRNGAGVAVMYTKKVKMLNNVFKDNWGNAAYGILLKDISDSEIRNNKFINNTAAIYMEGSSRLHIHRNVFQSNGCALKIQASCDDNVIEKNNFLGNTFDITTNSSLVLNTFNQNYWDKYEGYDLNRDGIGDVPYRPVSLFSMIIDRIPVAIFFLRSFLVNMLERAEKIIPSITPENLADQTPSMKPI